MHLQCMLRGRFSIRKANSAAMKTIIDARKCFKRKCHIRVKMHKIDENRFFQSLMGCDFDFTMATEDIYFHEGYNLHAFNDIMLVLVIPE